MKSIYTNHTSDSVSPLPGRWAFPLLTRFFCISPSIFSKIAAMEVSQQFISMASFLIPIKLLFLASRGENQFQIPGTDQVLSLGQTEVTLLIIPIGILPLINTVIRKTNLKLKETLAQKVADSAVSEDVAPNHLKQLINPFSRGFSSFCLAAACLTAMTGILWLESLILAACVTVATLLARYRIASLHSEPDFTEYSDESTGFTKDLPTVKRINDTAYASLQIILLPLFVYLVSGAILNQALDPIFALAYLLLFRLFVNASETCSAMSSQFLHNLIERRNILRLLSLNKIRL